MVIPKIRNSINESLMKRHMQLIVIVISKLGWVDSPVGRISLHHCLSGQHWAGIQHNSSHEKSVRRVGDEESRLHLFHLWNNPPLGAAQSRNPRVIVTTIIMQSNKVWWGRKWQPTPVSLPRKLHGQGSLVGCSRWHCKDWATARMWSSLNGLYNVTHHRAQILTQYYFVPFQSLLFKVFLSPGEP